MLTRSLAIGVCVVLGPAACKQASPSASQDAAQAPAVPVAAAAPLPIPSVAPQAPAAPALKTVSWTLFDGAELLICTEKTGPAEKVDAFVAAEKITPLKQSCDSLGRTALTTCASTEGSAVIKYYAVKQSDKHMASCIKGGGTWTTNKSPEAQMARAEQEFAAAKAAAGMP